MCLSETTKDKRDLVELTNNDILCIEHFCWISITYIIARVQRILNTHSQHFSLLYNT